LSATVWWLWHWLIIITEGIFLGPRLVVWLYDREAWKYDDIKAYEMEDELILLVEPVLGELDGQPNPTILDVATGTGRVPIFLFRDGRYQNDFGGRIIGLDASVKMLDYAHGSLKGYEPHFDSMLGSASHLPFPNNYFDGITCLESLEFFPDLEQAINEIVRVVKHDGFVMITRRAGWEAKWFFDRYYSREDFGEMLRQKGLTDVVLYTWQNNYDLAIGRKPKFDEIVPN
ncbi:MAG: methyltransferase domain-containing protein, partial [Chloroflexota bacterium]